MNAKSESVPLHGGQLGKISQAFDIPISQLVDFSANINPDGPPAAVLATLRSSLEDLSLLTTYPDLEQAALKHSIALYCGTSPQNLAVANGFVPLLECALRALQVKRCLLPVPAFVEYRRSLMRAGVEIEPHPLDTGSNFQYDLDALVNGKHDAILIANPQNPSGILSRKDFLRELVSRCAARNITVLLDEAFIDYTPSHSLATEVDQFNNLIVFRSVTKFHGIPGLRVAYAVTTEHVAVALNENLPSWPITTLAGNAVVTALQDKMFADRSRVSNDRRRDVLRDGFSSLGIETYPSVANFLLIRLPAAIVPRPFWERMIVDHHIVLRDCSNYEGLPSGHLRVAVRTERENEQLLSAISQALQNKPDQDE